MEKVSNEKRLEILNAAMSLFSERGFERTTVDEIAARANVGKGTIYLYFHNKEQIFFAVIENGLLELKKIFVTIQREPKPFLQQLEDMISAHLKFTEANRDFHRIFTKERMNLHFTNDDSAWERLKDIHLQTYSIMQDLLQSGIDQGILRSGDSLGYAIALLGIMTSYTMYWLLENKTVSLIDKAPSIMNLFLDGTRN